MIIVLDDFNGHVGGTPAGCPAVDPHGSDDCNENGDLLRDFCVSNNLLVTNTWFQHKLLHQCTWYWSACQARFCSSVLDTRVYRSTYLQSDNELVSPLRFKIKAKCHKSMRNRNVCMPVYMCVYVCGVCM